MQDNEFMEVHSNLMARIQREWEENEKFHKNQHKRFQGIRSSQISALVAVLLKEPERFLINKEK